MTVPDAPAADVLRRVFSAALQGYRRAAGAVPPMARLLCVGGHYLCVRAAGPALLAELTDALAHLSIAGTPQAGAAVRTVATIYAWDSATSGIEPPVPAATGGGSGGLCPGIYVARGSRLQVAVTEKPHTLQAYDPRQGIGVVWHEDAGPTPFYAGPLRHLLAGALQPCGLVGLHAGAVGLEAGAALLAGASGAGKSTTALACALAGMALVAEDFCLVQASPAPVVYSLYGSAKLTADAQRRLALPDAAATGRRVDGKQIYLLDRAPRVRLAERLPVRAVCVLRVAGRPATQVREISPAEALAALAPTSVRLLGLPAHAAPEVFHAAAQLVRQTRCYRFELGTDLARLPDLIIGVIAAG